MASAVAAVARRKVAAVAAVVNSVSRTRRDLRPILAIPVRLALAAAAVRQAERTTVPAARRRHWILRNLLPILGCLAMRRLTWAARVVPQEQVQQPTTSVARVAGLEQVPTPAALVVAGLVVLLAPDSQEALHPAQERLVPLVAELLMAGLLVVLLPLAVPMAQPVATITQPPAVVRRGLAARRRRPVVQEQQPVLAVAVAPALVPVTLGQQVSVAQATEKRFGPTIAAAPITALRPVRAAPAVAAAATHLDKHASGSRVSLTH